MNRAEPAPPQIGCLETAHKQAAKSSGRREALRPGRAKAMACGDGDATTCAERKQLLHSSHANGIWHCMVRAPSLELTTSAQLSRSHHKHKDALAPRWNGANVESNDCRRRLQTKTSHPRGFDVAFIASWLSTQANAHGINTQRTSDKWTAFFRKVC